MGSCRAYEVSADCWRSNIPAKVVWSVEKNRHGRYELDRWGFMKIKLRGSLPCKSEIWLVLWLLFHNCELSIFCFSVISRRCEIE